MPAGTVEDQQRVCARCRLRADFFEMLVHRFGIDRGHDDGGADAAGRANGTKQMDRVVADISYHGRARTNRSPDIGMATFLPHPGFVAEPYFNGFTRGGRAGEKRVLDQVGDVFLKVSCAATSCFG